jgi:tetratricopeptide (TPR) repeat protein
MSLKSLCCRAQGASVLVLPVLLTVACSREHYIEKGDEALADGNYQEAIERYRKALDKSEGCIEATAPLYGIARAKHGFNAPGTTDAFVEAADCAFEAGILDVARDSYRTAIGMAGDEASTTWCERLASTTESAQEKAHAYLVAGWIDHRSPKPGPARAVRYLMKSLSTAPSSQAYSLLGRVHLSQSDGNAALQTYREMLSHYPDDCFANYYVGLDGWQGDDLSAAESHLKRAAVCPEYAQALTAFHQDREAARELARLQDQESSVLTMSNYYSEPYSYRETSRGPDALDVIWEVVKPSWIDFVPAVGLLAKANRARKAVKAARALNRVDDAYDSYRAVNRFDHAYDGYRGYRAGALATAGYDAYRYSDRLNDIRRAKRVAEATRGATRSWLVKARGETIGSAVPPGLRPSMRMGAASASP